MTIVIKEIVVKATVENERKEPANGSGIRRIDCPIEG